MKLYFLEAPIGLTKSYTKTASELRKTSYPAVYEVTSHEAEVTSLQAFKDLLKAHAAKSHCLLKGQLSRPLTNESRKGTTDTNEPTQWVCLDIDGLPEQYQEPDLETAVVINGKSVVKVIPGAVVQVTTTWLLEQLGLGEYSHVIQWSASYGIENTKLRCHIFLLLDKPCPAPILKQWLIDKNLNTPVLTEALHLTKTGNALSWPLDISTCQNDKLIYIAAPNLRGIKDPMLGKPRITFIKGAKERFSISAAMPSTAKNREQMHRHLDRLREAEGLPKRKTTYKMHGTLEVLNKPDVCLVTEMKTERGFVYFNLNGGDSWAYYHPENNPDYIYNFKDEPVYVTKELLPAYWEELHQRTNIVGSDGIMHLAFLDPRTDRYYRGTWDTQAKDLKLESTTSALALKDYCKANGVPLHDDVVPEWTLTFDPHDNVRVDPDNRVINLFQPTPYMNAVARQVNVIPKTIKKVIHHVVGSDDESFDRFINWLAYALQARDRALTAWVFHGIPGTGKGTLLSKILRPIFGHEYVAVPRMKELEKEFNSFIDRSLIVAVDEVEAEAFQNERGVMSDLRRYITEEFVPLRRMHRDAVKVRNYTVWMFFSNASAPIRVSRDDRRFNVAKYQPLKLQITDLELAKIDTELQAFHDFLLYYQVNRDKVYAPLINEERESLMELTENAIDTVSNALAAGNMQFFIDQLPTDSRYTGDPRLVIKVDDFKSVINALLKRTDRNTGVCNAARDELRAIYEYTVGKIPDSPNKFTALVKHHHIKITKVWIDTKTVNGIKIVWQDTTDWQAYLDMFTPSTGKPTSKPVSVMSRVK